MIAADAAQDGERHSYGRAFRALAGYALFLGLVQVLAIAVSLLPLQIFQRQAIVILLTAATLAIVHARSIPGRAPRAEPASGFARGLAVFAVAFAGFVYAVSWLSALSKPDFSWDGNSYHIPMVHFWTLRGYIHWIAFDHDIGPDWSWFIHWLLNGYPKGVETISFVTTMAAGASYPVNACNLWFLPLGVAGLMVLARRFGASRPAAVATSVMFGVAPIMVGQGLTAYVDASLGYSIAALLGCLVEVLAQLRANRVPWDAALATGASVGLTAASKSSGLGPSLLAMGVLALAVGWLAARSEKTERARVVARYGAFFAVVAGVALAVTGYWYARSWWYTGNPLSPVRVAILGHEIFPGVPMADAVSEDGLTDPVLRPKSKLGRIAFTWLQGFPREYPKSIRYYDSHLGGIGFLWILACVPAIGIALVRTAHRLRSRPRGEPSDRLPPFVLFPAVFAIVFVAWWVTPMNWWARYTIWIYAAGLPALAVVVDDTAQIRRRVLQVAARAWLGVVFVVAAFEALFAFKHSGLSDGFLDRPRQITYTPSGIWHALTYYEKPAYFYENMSAMDRRVLTSSEAVAVGPMPLHDGPLLGQLAMPVGVRDIVLVSEATGRDEASLRALIAQKHIRWLLWRDDEYTPEAVLHVAKDADRTIGFWRTFEVGDPDPLASHDVRAK
jgi:hypothetical protein